MPRRSREAERERERGVLRGADSPSLDAAGKSRWTRPSVDSILDPIRAISGRMAALDRTAKSLREAIPGWNYPRALHFVRSRREDIPEDPARGRYDLPRSRVEARPTNLPEIPSRRGTPPRCRDLRGPALRDRTGTRRRLPKRNDCIERLDAEAKGTRSRSDVPSRPSTKLSRDRRERFEASIEGRTPRKIPTSEATLGTTTRRRRPGSPRTRTSEPVKPSSGREGSSGHSQDPVEPLLLRSELREDLPPTPALAE